MPDKIDSRQSKIAYKTSILRSYGASSMYNKLQNQNTTQYTKEQDHERHETSEDLRDNSKKSMLDMTDKLK